MTNFLALISFNVALFGAFYFGWHISAICAELGREESQSGEIRPLLKLHLLTSSVACLACCAYVFFVVFL